MGRLARFFGLEPKEKKSVSKDVRFVTEMEGFDYSGSIMGLLLSQELDLEFIKKYIPQSGNNLIEQAEALKKLLLVSNDEESREVKEAFEKYREAYRVAFKRAEGLSTIEQLDNINSDLNGLFLKPVSVSKLDKQLLLNYIEAIEALQKKVDDAEREGAPILSGPSKQLFNDKSLESEYRLKMLEVMYVISQDEEGAMNGKTLNDPFGFIHTAQSIKYPILFKKDVERLAEDYGLLSYCYDLFNKYSKNKFSDLEKVVDSLDLTIGKETLRDYTFKKMFSGDLPQDELFEHIKKMVFIRYKVNEMQHEISDLTEMKQKEESSRAQEEERRRLLKEQEENNRRTAAEMAEAEARKLVDASDEEIQEKINELNHDVTQTGSRFINIIDFQKKIAKARGLLPADDMVQDPNLVYKVFSANGITNFIKIANKSGVNYLVFPNSQEGNNGGFNVLVSKSDQKVLNFRDENCIFSSSKRDYAPNGSRIQKWKKHGTVPSYYLIKIQEMYEKSEEENKKGYKDFIYADQIKDSGIYEIGVMSYYRDTSPYTDKFLTSLVREADEELRRQWKEEREGKDILSYVSIPATHNIIPLLRQFKEKGVTPYMERVPFKDKRNTQNRDRIQIYFYRSDFDKFWDDIRPVLLDPSRSDGKIVPFEVHYGKDFDFRQENSLGLNIPYLEETEKKDKKKVKPELKKDDTVK